MDGKSMAVKTSLRRAPSVRRHDSATAWAVVTFSCMLTVPAGAPMTAATLSPTSPAMPNQRSSHARTPRVAHTSAYSASERAAAAGMAPSELLIM